MSDIPKNPSPGTSGEARPNAEPVLEIDPQVGAIADVQVDTAWIAQLMAAEEGIDDADIAATKLRVAADTVLMGDDKKTVATPTEGTILGFGHYDPTNDTVQVNIGTLQAQFINFCQSEAAAGDPLSKEDADELASWAISNTAMHELGHRVARLAVGFDYAGKLEYYGEIVPEKFFGRVFRRLLRMSYLSGRHDTAVLHRKLEVAKAMDKSGHDHYRHSPEEVAADEFSDRAMEQLPDGYFPVRVVFKPGALAGGGNPEEASA